MECCTCFSGSGLGRGPLAVARQGGCMQGESHRRSLESGVGGRDKSASLRESGLSRHRHKIRPIPGSKPMGVMYFS